MCSTLALKKKYGEFCICRIFFLNLPLSLFCYLCENEVLIREKLSIELWREVWAHLLVLLPHFCHRRCFSTVESVKLLSPYGGDHLVNRQ